MSPVAVSQLSLFSESGVDEEATPGTLESQTGRHNSQQSPADKSITPAQRPRSGEREEHVVTTVATYSSPSPECLTSGDETRERPHRQM